MAAFAKVFQLSCVLATLGPHAAAQQVESAAASLREEVISELYEARAQEQGSSKVRQELLAELRDARAQRAPQPSPLRQELLAELRAAREQAAPAPSAVRSELLSELRAAREEEEKSMQAKAAPSGVRLDIMTDLRAARMEALLAERLDKKAKQRSDSGAGVQDVYSADLLPWSDDEQLLDTKSEMPAAAAEPAAIQIEAFNRLLRTLVLSGVAAGLAAAAKLPELNLKQANRSPCQWLSLALFAMPLLLVSADYILETAVGNDLSLIAGCWGLAGMVAVHMRAGSGEKLSKQ
eukprot:TRINITY_DN112023_c0_g1_i1.p1 TRINITY_DN112023_c0_g1~~TRINITY_DN112023_c0_g1_i1.p1  ORF type:complete len:326 (-),score=81.82 TRINITY_DN112023_c0_g1_i1:65-943(-)